MRGRVFSALVLVLVAAGASAPVGRAASDTATFSLSWVGDMSFSRAAGLPTGGGDSVFSDVRDELDDADLTTGNLEGTLGRGGPSKCRGTCFAFQAPPAYAGAYRRAGFELLNMANNHSHDFALPGLQQTLAALEGAGIAHTGLQGEVAALEIHGIKIAFLGFAPYPWTGPLLDIPAASREVALASKQADVVVVFIHAGAEGAGAMHTPHGTETAFGENRGSARRFAHAVVDAGADAVLGSGPHVLRGMECYRHAVIAYSLGNFVGYRTLSTAGVVGLSGILHVHLAADGRFAGGQLLPVRLAAPGVPRRDASRASVKLVRRLSKQDFGARACRMSHSGRIRPR